MTALIAAAMLGTTMFAQAQQAEEPSYTPDDTRAAISQASAEIGVSEAYLTAIVRCETGSTFDPYSVGRLGELGAVQLAPWGELKRFYRVGYLNPFSPYQAVRFLAQRIVAGGVGAWSCA